VPSLDVLRKRIDALAMAGQTAPWGAEARLALDTEHIGIAATTRRGLYASATSGILVKAVRCASDAGVTLVVAEGNYKDEATLVAAAAIVVAFADAFEMPLLAEADVAPALRRSVLRAHDAVLALSRLPVEAGRFGTCAGQRTSLVGIGASLAAAVILPGRAWCVAIGECPIWLLRDGEARRLSLPHTLAHHPGYRAAVRDDPSRAIDFAHAVVTRVLGLSQEAPDFDVTRLDLHAADRIVFGNEWVEDCLPGVATGSDGRSGADLCRALVAALERDPAPIPITVAVAARA
jgi:hypothetical protein